MEKNIYIQKETRNIFEEKTDDIYKAIPLEIEEDISNKSPEKKAESTSINFDKELSRNDLFNKTMSKQKQNLSSYNKSYCRSRFRSSVIEYTWEIDRAITLLQSVREVSSAWFPGTALYKIKLSIDIDNEMSNSKVRFYLVTEEKCTGTCNIFLTHAVDCDKVYNTVYAGLMTNMTLLYETPLELFGKEILSRDKIVICFKFEILDRLHTRSVHMNITPTITLFCNNFNVERALLVNMKTNDEESVAFIVNKKLYNIPKTLLRAINSTYFNKICDMLENNKNDIPFTEVKIDDMPIAFKEMLIYILSGALPTRLDCGTLIDLLRVAHKYDVKTLKLTCEHYLLRMINIHNSVDLIMLAFSCNAKILEEKAAIFIKFYLKEITYFKKFEHLSQEDRNKIFELISEIKISFRSQSITYNRLNSLV